MHLSTKPEILGILGIPGNLSKPINVRPWMKSANASKHSSFILMVVHSLAARSICNARFPRAFPNARSTRGELARNTELGSFTSLDFVCMYLCK
jgi:hypothetical protein